MTVGTGVITWAGDLLEADPDTFAIVGAKIYDSLAGEDDDKPYVIINQQSNRGAGTNARGDLSTRRIMLLVKVITEGSGYAQAEAVYARIVAVLHQAAGTSNGVKVQSCIWQSEVRYVEVGSGEGVRYNHLGGVFLIYANEA